MTPTLRGVGGGKAKRRCHWMKGVGVIECLCLRCYFIKENWIYAMTRHAEPNIDILLTSNLPFDTDVRQ